MDLRESGPIEKDKMLGNDAKQPDSRIPSQVFHMESSGEKGAQGEVSHWWDVYTEKERNRDRYLEMDLSLGV